MAHLYSYSQHPNTIETQVNALCTTYPGLVLSKDSQMITISGNIQISPSATTAKYFLPLSLIIPFQYPHAPPALSSMCVESFAFIPQFHRLIRIFLSDSLDLLIFRFVSRAYFPPSLTQCRERSTTHH